MPIQHCNPYPKSGDDSCYCRKTRLIGFVVLCFCWVTFVGYAQDDAPTHPVDGEYIKEWLVLGPFFPDNLDTDFLESAGGEANINPKEGDTVTTADGKTLTWKRYTVKGNIVDLLDAVGNHENTTAYAFCLLQSEGAGNVEIGFGNDDDAVVWIDGKQVHRNPGGGSVTLDRHQFGADLKAGKTSCLVKVAQQGGAGKV